MNKPAPPKELTASVCLAPKPDETGAQQFALRFDPSRYSAFLEESGWSAEEKIAHIKIFWDTLSRIADLAFRFDAVNLAITQTLEEESSAMLASASISNFEQTSAPLEPDCSVARGSDSACTTN